MAVVLSHWLLDFSPDFIFIEVALDLTIIISSQQDLYSDQFIKMSTALDFTQRSS